MSLLPFFPAAKRVGLMALAAVAIVGCAPMLQYRTQLEPPAKLNCDLVANHDQCGNLATEPHANYTLQVTEFDDQGWPYKSSQGEKDQIDVAVNHLADILRDPGNCVRVFIYVHGWHHTAQYDDKNIVSFRWFLDKVSATASQQLGQSMNACNKPAPGAAMPRRMAVVGIYVGWRGDSFAPGTVLDFTSFWDRKDTAERVAQGSVRELFARLDALSRASMAKTPSGEIAAPLVKRMRVYLIGHSFGASIAFRAISQSLIDGFAEGIDAPEVHALRFLDMAVLVNPAIEAARFDSLFRTANKRRQYCLNAGGKPDDCERPAYQAPLLAVFTAESDSATRVAFPIGATLSNAFEYEQGKEERDANRKTIGWDDAYKTHTLVANPNGCTPSPMPAPGPWTPGQDGSPIYSSPGWTWCVGGLTVAHLGSASAPTVYNGPIWNVRVESTKIIDGHNGMWGDDFRELLVSLFADEIAHTFQMQMVKAKR